MREITRPVYGELPSLRFGCPHAGRVRVIGLSRRAGCVPSAGPDGGLAGAAGARLAEQDDN
jgi:hypothetical protein